MADTVLQPVECNGATMAVRRDLSVIIGWFALLSAAYWAAVLIVSGQIGFPLDDSFIHLQFARNLYESGQMAFNPGIPSSGSTAPLWPMLIAAAYPLVKNWYLTSLILGALCSLGAALAVYGIMRSWTGRLDLARWAGLLTVFVSPTLIQAYTGMESAAYSLCFLIGLWLYGYRRLQLPASAVFALCVWLRPEFLVMLPLVCLERAVAAWRSERQRLAVFLRGVWPHVLIWAVMTLAYASYNWHQDGHLVPNTFEAKAVAPASIRPAWLDGLPAALKRGDPFCIFLSIVVWPPLVLLSVSVGLTINCAPLGFGLREALVALWKDTGPAASARRLAVITLIGYPWLRGFVDASGLLIFQFQRYYAHLTPLLVLVVISALPTTGAVVKRRFWNWSGKPLEFQQNHTFRWAAGCFLVMGTLSVMAVWNINSMQVPLGHWVREHTSPDQLVATNDIGAIGFISQRPILDTVGLIEPPLVRHYLNGGSLLTYLRKKNPAYVIAFPWWCPEIGEHPDLLEPVHSVTLGCNVICGGSTMVVYRPKWGESVGE
jgi:hypothetical protein